MKRLVALIGIILLLSSFAAAISITSDTIDNSSGITGEPIAATVGSDNESPVLVGGCGSVSPTNRDACCKDAGYDYFNTTKGRCIGSLAGGCGSVSPTNRDTCCKEGGYTSWSNEEVECVKATTDDDNDSVGEDGDDDFDLETRAAEVVFCGKSTFEECQADADCVTAGCAGQVCQSKNRESEVTTCEWKDCYNSTLKNIKCACIKNRCMWNRLTLTQINKIRQWQNEINVTAKYWNACPSECTCSGSTVKCQLASGRVMTVYAGKSGNMIIQVKGENMSTNVTLYKFGKGVYGVFKGNETKEIKMFPDQVRERIRERLKSMLENENVSLENNGVYKYAGDKKVKLFLIIPVNVRVKAEIDPTTGEITKLRAGRWWTFLAKDENPEPLGASCGTVTPGQNDACCQTKGFDFWNAESQECELNV